MDNENPNQENQELDLDESLDALLNEIDMSCAEVRNRKTKQGAALRGAGEFTPEDAAEDEEQSEAGDEGSGEAEVKDESAADESETDGEQEAQAADDAEAGAEEIAQDEAEETTDAGDEALEAVEAVSENAQSLLEDAIGDLLDKDEAGAEDASGGETEADETEPDADSGADDPLSEIADELTAEAGSPETEAADEPDAQDQAYEGADEGADAAAAEETSDEADDEGPGEVIDRLPDEPAAEAPASEEPATEEAAAAPDAEDDADPDAAAGGEAAAESDGDDQDAQSVDELDEVLAHLGDELLQGDFETPDGEMVSVSPLQEDMIDPVLLLDQLDLPEGEEGGAEGKAPEAKKPASGGKEKGKPKAPAAPGPDSPMGDTVSAVQAASARAGEEISGPKRGALYDAYSSDLPVSGNAASDEIESIWQTALRVAKTKSLQVWAIVSAKCGPVAARGLLAMSKPLKDKPASIKDSVGYVALWTLLLATVLWFYSIFFRAPDTPTPAQAPSRVLEPGEASTGADAVDRP